MRPSRPRQRIVIYGDYDVDGMAGTAILYLCLKLLGAEVSYYVPHRVDEGYGLNCEAVQSWGNGRAALMITVDCGIGGVEEAVAARQCGLDLIITDHHTIGPQLPEAAAIVHPQLAGTYPFGGLSGSGVAFKLAWALCQQASGAQKVSPRLREFLVQAVGLAALGTVADVVPLVDENRVLVHHGLESLARCPTLGLATLMKIAKIEPQGNGDGKPRLDSDDIGFALAPRLNAAGRLAQAQLGVELLVTDRADRALELAQYIDQLNGTRQTLERSMQIAAKKQIDEQFQRGRRCGLRAGRARLAPGRDRHRRRPAGREASSARGAHRLGRDGHAAGHRLGAEHSRLRPARRPGSLRRMLCWRTAAMRRRPACGSTRRRSTPSARPFARWRRPKSASSSGWPTC